MNRQQNNQYLIYTRKSTNDSNNQNGYVSHECVCILNTGEKNAQIDLTIYFEDSDPEYVKGLVVGAQRSCHLRMDQLEMKVCYYDTLSLQ